MNFLGYCDNVMLMSMCIVWNSHSWSLHVVIILECQDLISQVQKTLDFFCEMCQIIVPNRHDSILTFFMIQMIEMSFVHKKIKDKLYMHTKYVVPSSTPCGTPCITGTCFFLRE